MSTLDQGLVKAILREGTLLKVAESGVDLMLQGEGKDAYEVIQRHFGSYGVLPDASVLRREIGGLALAGITDAQDQPLKYYLEAIRKRSLTLHLDEGLREVIDKLKGADPFAAMDNLKQILQKASELKLERGTGTNLTKEVQSRLDQYDYVKSLGDGIDGWRMPWPTINKVTQGLHRGEISFIVGRTYSGKTWNLMECMIPMIDDNANVMVISMEMPHGQVGRRLDSLMGRFKYDDLRKGNLSDEDFERYRRMLTEDYSRLGDVWCYGPPRVKTVQDIELLYQQHRPDIILVDGVYLLGGGGVSDRYLKVTHAAEELKYMTVANDIHIIGTTQFAKDASKGKRKEKMDGGVEEVGYAYALSQIADLMLAVFQNADFKIQKQLLIRILKAREAGECLGIVTNWDFDTMNFSEVGIWDGDSVLQTDEFGNIVSPPEVTSPDEASDIDNLSF